MAIIQTDDRILVGVYDDGIPGYTWTLPSRFGEMLTLAEERYGGRDKNYTILGFEFVEDSQCLYYLGDEIYKQVLIHLPTHALEDYEQCLYMAAHESVHCLSPDRNVQATRLEEGLAANFARIYMDHIGLGDDWRSTSDDYNEAQQDVEDLLNLDRDIIRKARSIQPAISLISGEDLLRVNSYLPGDLIDRLVITF
jgi:hypothetical protein